MRVPGWIPAGAIPRSVRYEGALRSLGRVAIRFFGTYGWLRSFREGRCIDASGNPVPWFTYPAIDFLSQLDYSGRSVFEYGSGASTLFWARRAGRVVSVEPRKEWHDKLAKQLPPHCELVLSGFEIHEYAEHITRFGKFDVIVVDGGSRPLCCRTAIAHVKPGGMVILDNSDVCPQSAAILRDAGFIQADFTGFGPLMDHASTTSVFFTRDYDFQPTDGHQPHRSVAQPEMPWPDES